MAMGAYMGAGGVKDLRSCYVGAGGVKTVKQIYIGQGSSVKLVWPSYIYDEGSWGTLGNGMAFGTWSSSSTSYPQVTEYSTYIRLYAAYDSTYSLTTATRGAYCNSSIDVSLYSKMVVTFDLVSKGYSGGSNSSMTIGCCTSQPSFNSSYNMTIPGTDYSVTQALSGVDIGTGLTLSVDLSSVSRSVYPYIGCNMGTALNTNSPFNIHVTRIELVI